MNLSIFSQNLQFPPPTIRYKRVTSAKKFAQFITNGEMQEKQQIIFTYSQNFVDEKKAFSINVPIMDKPGSWLLPAKCLKNNCGRVTFC